MFEAAYPGTQALFLFDNAISHSAYAIDALRVSKMNKGKGGKQPCMKVGYYTDEKGNRVIQQMTVEHTNEPKGLQIILEC